MYGEERRIPLTWEEIPEQMTQAFLAAEDDRFFEHPGVDVFGLMRAVIELVRTGEKRQGGSTITMQVARNFYLSREKTYLERFETIMDAVDILFRGGRWGGLEDLDGPAREALLLDVRLRLTQDVGRIEAIELPFRRLIVAGRR